MRRISLLALLLLSCLAPPAPADDQKGPAGSIASNDHGDPILKAMLSELKRSQEKLQLGQLQRPYYIDYQVTELKDYIADATLGALRNEQTNVGRLVRVVVRIGDHNQDSYYGGGMGSVEVM